MTTAPQDGKTQIVARHAPNEHTPHGWIATITMDPDDPDEHRRSGLDTIVHYNGDALLRGFHGMWTGWMYPEEFAALASAPAVTAPPAGTSESPSDWARFRPNLGFRTPEPSIREIVRRYYALHLSPVKASELADRYIAAVASRPQTKEAGASDA